MKALIVDDEQFCRDNLRMMVEEYCPEISDIILASDADEARRMVREHKPEVLFLDIKMPKESGFELLESLNSKDMSVIFTTAHNEYALKALKGPIKKILFQRNSVSFSVLRLEEPPFLWFF